MPTLELLSVGLGMSIFLVSLVMFYQVRRMAGVEELRRWWGFLGVLIVFFLAGYAVFFVFLLQGATPSVDINMMISQIFFWGSIFVLACAWLFLGTLRQSKKIDQELRDAQARLRHAQKLEAVGRLAGNVAHDFNNLLTAIMGHADLGARSLDPASPQANNFAEISAAAERAEKLTSQLLAFSRRKPARKESLSLRQLLTSIETLLRQALDPHVHLTINTEIPGWVICDPDQIRMLIINLVTNANDAVKRGGEVSIELKDAERGVATMKLMEIGDHAIAPSYVELSVTDNGQGIAESDQLQIFDPYFTTKEAGKGTGLGLSIAYGIARQHEGVLEVESTPGQGSSFILYLPAIRARELPPESTAGARKRSSSHSANTRILVIDDDVQVLNLTSMVLRQEGFQVQVANSTKEAMGLIEERGEQFQLLLCDVLLPNMSGPELVELIKQKFPDILVVFMSGYPGESGDLLPDAFTENKLIMKPFAPQQLLETIQGLL
jgi:signal transduction histidine kinase/CheY-like chemotaxis protein